LRLQAEADLQANGEKAKAAIPEREDHNQHNGIKEKPPPPYKLPEKPWSPDKQRNETHANNVPIKIPDLFQMG
jgi:hypothetical protein